MISRDCIITVNGNTATIDSDIYLYKYDKNIQLIFMVINSKYMYDNDDSNNLIKNMQASYAQVKFKKNDSSDIEIEFDTQATEKGAVLLTINEELTDEDTELGDYTIQIRLLDSNKNSVVTLPPVESCIHILAPLFEKLGADTNEVNKAVVNKAVARYAAPLSATTEDGTFNSKTWVDKDKITTAELNRIEEGIKTNSSHYKEIAKKIENVGGFDTSKFMYVTKEVEDVDVPCTGITLNTNTLTFTGSDTQTLTVTKTPSNTTDKVTYTTNPTGIVVVNNGVITPIKNGSTVITVTCGSKTATCNVTVTGISTTVAVQSVSLNKNTTTINVGETETLVATISPTNATNQNVTWGTDAPNIATVTNGVVEGKAVGTASISVETVDGSHTDTCNVTVQQNTTETGKNIFDKDTMIDTTKGISTNGEIITNSNWGLAAVPVKANTTYSIKRLETVTSGSDNYLYNAVNVGAIGFADSNKTILSYVALDNSNLKNYSVTNSSGKIEWLKIITPTNCSYLLFNANLRTTADKIQVEEGDTIHNYYTAYEGGNN